MLFALTLLTGVIKADPVYETIDGIHYKIEGAVAEVSPDVEVDYNGNITIPSSITYNATSYPVVGIRDNAFLEKTHMTGIEMPSTITYIGDNAFRGCTTLASVSFSDNIAHIGEHAFYDCILLTSINLPSKIHVVEENVFMNCFLLYHGLVWIFGIVTLNMMR